MPLSNTLNQDRSSGTEAARRALQVELDIFIHLADTFI